jgi:hypothetical protein
MTIAIGLKIGDGVILGADSAVTVGNPYGGNANFYFNAEKIINLVKGLPLGAVTYGLFGFSGRSTTRLAKDLRRRLSDPNHAEWVNPENYTVEEVATRVRDFFCELYRSDHPQGGPGTGFGFMIAGYGPNAARGELWNFEVDETGACAGPNEVLANDIGVLYRGEGEPLNRLLRGWSWTTIQRLASEEWPPGDVIKTLDAVAPLWHAAMPIQDGIDLVRYLIEVTAGFVRFLAKPNTVAPPIDIAAITLHEGFRWVDRKHYYRSELNHQSSAHERPYSPPTPEVLDE